MAGILEGLRIIEGSAFVAAPLGGMTLAQLGAEVIRFDPIGGGLDYKRWPVTHEGKSLFWAGLNKGKKSIAVDIGKPEGQALLTELITAPGEDRGMFLTNFPTRGWLSYEVLKKKRDDLILVNVQGNRHGGSEVDYTVNPGVGFPLVTGDPKGSEPVNHVLPAWDNICGQMAAVGLLAAERHRRLKGEGQLVKVALKDVALATAANLGFLAEVQINNQDRQNVGNYLFGGYGKDFVTKDNRRVMLVGLTSRQWNSIVEIFEIAEPVVALAKETGLDLTKEGDRYKAKEGITQILAPRISQYSLQELEQKFAGSGVCWGPYRSFRQMVDEDPDCSTDNPMFQAVNQPGIGEYLMPGSPLKFSAGGEVNPMAAPILGEHTDQILADLLGLSAGEIGKLHDQKIVAGPDLT